MLEQFQFTGRELLIAVILATVIYLMEVLIFSRRRKSSGSREIDRRIDQMQTQIDELQSRLERLEALPPAESALDKQTSTYAEAVRLARDGKTASELAADLGISLSEADLIIALQREES